MSTRKVFRPLPHNAGYEVVAHLNGQVVTIPGKLNESIGSDDTVVIQTQDNVLYTAFLSELENVE